MVLSKFRKDNLLPYCLMIFVFICCQDRAVAREDFLSKYIFRTSQAPPQGTGTTRTGAAGSRNPCPGISKELTLLASKASNYTTQPHPTFWFYVPYEQNLIKSAKLSLKSSGEKTIKLEINLKKTPGFNSFTLPSRISMEIEKQYEVVLTVKAACNGKSTPTDHSTTIQVTRKELGPRLKSKIEQAKTPQERTLIFVENGFWLDAFNLSVQNFKSDNGKSWQQLLKKAGLETFVDLDSKL
jgi:Domain of Unknown Function (DUF928)